ncbi:MAG: Fe-S cluster assembly protein SufD [Thermoanaerobaculia bacterium]
MSTAVQETRGPQAVAPATQEGRYVEAFEALARHLPREPERLGALRRQAIDRFVELGFPRTTMEEWRKTPLAPIARAPFELASVDGAGLEGRAIEELVLAGCHTAVFVNGRFSPGLSDLEDLPAGVVVDSIAAALESGDETVEQHLGRYAKFEEHAFVALNTALWSDGALVRLPRGVVVEKPIHLLFLGRPGESPTASFPRNLIVAEEQSQARVVEQYASLGDGVQLTCPVTEVLCGPAAVVDHYKLGRESIEAFHLGTLQLLQDRDSAFSSHSISWGGALVRNDVNAVLAGEGSDANLNGLYLVEGTQLVDNHMRVEHVSANCSSHELYKGILEGQSRAVFSGRIYVHKGAQKTDAKQTNRNLLLSDQALVNSNPQLEIFADDVKCTHGSTVGRLDELAIFYLRSRGIGEEAARSLLTYAFASDIVGRVRVEPLRRELEEFLFRRLPKGDIVRQAV